MCQTSANGTKLKLPRANLVLLRSVCFIGLVNCGFYFFGSHLPALLFFSHENSTTYVYFFVEIQYMVIHLPDIINLF